MNKEEKLFFLIQFGVTTLVGVSIVLSVIGLINQTEIQTLITDNTRNQSLIYTAEEALLNGLQNSYDTTMSAITGVPIPPDRLIIKLPPLKLPQL